MRERRVRTIKFRDADEEDWNAGAPPVQDVPKSRKGAGSGRARGQKAKIMSVDDDATEVDDDPHPNQFDDSDVDSLFDDSDFDFDFEALFDDSDVPDDRSDEDDIHQSDEDDIQPSPRNPAPSTPPPEPVPEPPKVPTPTAPLTRPPVEPLPDDLMYELSLQPAAAPAAAPAAGRTVQTGLGMTWGCFVFTPIKDGSNTQVGWEVHCPHPDHQDPRTCRLGRRWEAYGRTRETTERMLKAWCMRGINLGKHDDHKNQWAQVVNAFKEGVLEDLPSNAPDIIASVRNGSSSDAASASLPSSSSPLPASSLTSVMPDPAPQEIAKSPEPRRKRRRRE